VVIFSVEYILRIWACIEFEDVAEKGPIRGRLFYATRFFPLVDFVSIAPYWGYMLAGSESPDFTTALRCFRLIRLLKAEKYLRSFATLATVLAENSTLLVASSFYAVLMWLIFATALYVAEVDNPANGTHFQSIPQAMFPVLLMLTGEFPLADFTPIGQVIAGSIAVVAVAIFAVPSAVLASGFIKALQGASGKEFTVDID
jgi:voltage-gated potassium channel